MTSTWRYRGIRMAVVAASLSLGSGLLASPAAAQAPAGDYLFRTYCAACHGSGARGDGPLADSMRRRPADLTAIATRNKGVFPAEEVFRTIDGRQPVKGHGGPDMPVWGDVFSRSVEAGNPALVEARIRALVAYLAGLQMRPAN